MTILQIHSIHSLAAEYYKQYKGIASDGIYFYCTVPQYKEIHRYDQNFEAYEIYPICRPYSSICYDKCENCFWAVSPENASNVYQLDCEFQETKQLHLSFPEHSPDELTGIACDEETNQLIITSPNLLMKIRKRKNARVTMIDKASPCQCYLCVEMPFSEYLIASYGNECPQITLSCCSEEIPLHCFLGNEYTPVDFSVQYISPKSKWCQLCILAVDSCNCCHILKGILSSCRQEEPPVNPQNCSDLIESIALMEASLAHILNAEGEKLQKIIQCSHDFCEIMEVNDSVNQTIKNVTCLEKVLLEKLQVAKQLCGYDSNSIDFLCETDTFLS